MRAILVAVVLILVANSFGDCRRALTPQNTHQQKQIFNLTIASDFHFEDHSYDSPPFPIDYPPTQSWMLVFHRDGREERVNFHEVLTGTFPYGKTFYDVEKIAFFVQESNHTTVPGHTWDAMSFVFNFDDAGYAVSVTGYERISCWVRTLTRSLTLTSSWGILVSYNL